MLSIKSIMTKDVVTVTPETPIYDAMRLLMRHRISGMPVVDEQMHVKGVLSEKDVLQILIDSNIKYKDTVVDYMTKDVISFSEDESAVKVCQFFIKNHFRRVPIVKDGKLIGIVSRRDLIELILEANNKISNDRLD